jgi:Di-haem oxidoreductase, putative peroxidase
VLTVSRDRAYISDVARPADSTKAARDGDVLMGHQRTSVRVGLLVIVGAVCLTGIGSALGQLIDRTQAPNAANEGIAKSLDEQLGIGRGDIFTPNSSAFVIARDPFRAIRRGRQLFQRKFTRTQGQGPAVGDGHGDIQARDGIGAGLADNCATCHGRPRGSAGFGGNVVTRPDSRDAPHLFGVGLKEMLADEITGDLRAIRAQALDSARQQGVVVKANLLSKGIDFGHLVARPDGSVDTSGIEGVDPDLRVRPFRAHGGNFSLRSFAVGAFNGEMGLDSEDPDLAAASAGGRVTTPAGIVLDGALDRIDPPFEGTPGDSVKEVPESLIDFMEFYLLNYFKPALYRQTPAVAQGRRLLEQLGCGRCHVPDLELARDRRVADVETVHAPQRGVFNGLFATAVPLHGEVSDRAGLPPCKPPLLGSFLVRNIFTDFKRHDLGPAFHERNFDGTLTTHFMTAPLWGVGSTAPYGHDGRSINLTEVILRHGGEAQLERDRFAALPFPRQAVLLEFLNSLVLFPPDDTASNLDSGDPRAPGFPQHSHGSISLRPLFNDPSDPE